MLAALIKKTPWLKLQGVFTHFSCGFCQSGFYEISVKPNFWRLRTLLQAHGWH